MTRLLILTENILSRKAVNTLQKTQEPLTFPQTVFSKPQYNRRQALPLITDEEQAAELNQERAMFLVLV